MKRLEIGRGRGCDQADVLRDGGERAEQGDRLDTVRHRGALPDVDVVGTEGGLGVGVEHEIEQPTLGELREVHVVAELLARGRIDRRIAPGGDVVPGSMQEEAKLHHALMPSMGLQRQAYDEPRCFLKKSTVSPSARSASGFE